MASCNSVESKSDEHQPTSFTPNLDNDPGSNKEAMCQHTCWNHNSPTFLVTPADSSDSFLDHSYNKQCGTPPLADSAGNSPQHLSIIHSAHHSRSTEQLPTRNEYTLSPNSARKSLEKFFSRPLQRSRSACTREAPAHALFLSENYSGGSQTSLKKSTEDLSDSEIFYPRNVKEKKAKKKCLIDIKELFKFFKRSETDLVSCGNLYAKCHDKPNSDTIRKWGTSFESLLKDRYGLSLFHNFLQTEYSEENIQFWMACESYRNISDSKKMTKEAQKIYRDFLSVQAPKEVNLDSVTRLQTISNLEKPNRMTFDLAQKRIQALMEKDSYQRFLRSDIYPKFLKAAEEYENGIPTKDSQSKSSNFSPLNSPSFSSMRKKLSFSK